MFTEIHENPRAIDVARALLPAASPLIGTLFGRMQCQWRRRSFRGCHVPTPRDAFRACHVPLPLRLLAAWSFTVLISFAQVTNGRDPHLMVDLQQPGSLHAWLSMSEPVPAEVALAFARAMGCPPSAVRPTSPRASVVLVACAAVLKPAGLRGTMRWDLTALNTALSHTGAEAITIDVSSARSSSMTFMPDGMTADHLAGYTYHGHFRLGEFTYIALQVGGRPSDVRLLAASAVLILLLPLLLFPARRGGPLPATAAANGLFCLGATAWLSALMRVNPPAVLPFPWSFALTFLPMVAAVWEGACIAGGRRRRLFFWRGTLIAAVLTLCLGLLSVNSALVPWVSCCVVAMAVCFWGLHRAGGHRFERVTEGEFLTRVHELAGRAGTRVRNVRLLLGGEELPSALASRNAGIIISRSALASLSRREVDAILAHELSHIRRPALLAVRMLPIVAGGTAFVAVLVPSFLPWAPLLMPPVYLLHRALRRRIERQADADALAWSGDPEALITGLARITRAHGMPLEWPLWVKPLMTHPPTMERVRRVASQAGIPEGRLASLLEPSTNPPGDGYPAPNPSVSFGSVYTPAVRARLGQTLALVMFAFPVLFGVAAPFIGQLWALGIGAFTLLLGAEWVLARCRARARAQLSGRPGVFAGFSPSSPPLIYDGSYDYDWGFAAFEDHRLVFRGDRGDWQLERSQIERIWLGKGPFTWLPNPIVCFRTRGGQVLSLRPFDNALGLARRRAATGFLEQAIRWHSSAPAADVASTDPEPTFPKGQPPIPYTARTLLRSLPRYAAFCVTIYPVVALLSGQVDWTQPGRLLGALPVTWALVLFMAYPGIRRTQQARLAGPPPLVPAQPR